MQCKQVTSAGGVYWGRKLVSQQLSRRNRINKKKSGEDGRLGAGKGGMWWWDPVGRRFEGKGVRVQAQC